MISFFTDSVLGLMEIVWLMAITVVLIVTIPIWFIPYTVFALHKKIKEKNT